jgi:hypothetical protein
VKSRKNYWKGKGTSTFGEGRAPRTDFMAECPDCGFKGEIKPDL